MSALWKPGSEPRNRARRPTKKNLILNLFRAGMGDIEELAAVTHTQTSYVAAVLRQAGLLADYFDLYTTTTQPMNVFSGEFAGKLGFKDVETAQQSVKLIDQVHYRFQQEGNRPGQHHALVMALTMFNRARWSGKSREAEVFRQWLQEQLDAVWRADRSEPEPLGVYGSSP
jgi:hypothetical protein